MCTRQGGMFWVITSKLLLAVTSYVPLLKPSVKMPSCITECRIGIHWTGYVKYNWNTVSAENGLLQSMGCYIRDDSSRKGIKWMVASFVSVKDKKAVQTTKRSRTLYQNRSPSSHFQNMPQLGHTLHPCLPEYAKSLKSSVNCHGHQNMTAAPGLSGKHLQHQTGN